MPCHTALGVVRPPNPRCGDTIFAARLQKEFRKGHFSKHNMDHPIARQQPATWEITYSVSTDADAQVVTQTLVEVKEPRRLSQAEVVLSVQGGEFPVTCRRNTPCWKVGTARPWPGGVGRSALAALVSATRLP